jgi:hypothetical protein
LPSRWWCSSWSFSAGMFFLDHFCGGTVSCFSVETRWAPMLEVSENPDRIPKHEREERADTFSSGTQMTLKETKNLLKTVHTSKVVNAFTRAPHPLL